MNINKTWPSLGNGFLAGAVGVVGLMLSQEIEKRFFHQQPSRALADAADELLNLHQKAETGKAEFNTLVEIIYGSGWGIFRNFLGNMGVTGPGASALHLAAIGANVSLLMPALGLVPPVRAWNKEILAFELMHHSVYVTFTGLADEYLSNSRKA